MQHPDFKSRSALILLFAGWLTLALAADDPEACFQRAGKYMEQGKYAQAIQEYNRIIEMGMVHPELYNNLALAYSRTADGFPKAVESFKKAIELNPKYSEAYLNLGAAYNSKGEYKNAAQIFKQLTEASPDYARGYFGLGWSNYMGKLSYAEAARAFREAIRLDPGYPQSYLGLGLALVAEGNKELALEPITALRKMNRTDLADMIENAIKSGEAAQQEEAVKRNNELQQNRKQQESSKTQPDNKPQQNKNPFARP